MSQFFLHSPPLELPGKIAYIKRKNQATQRHPELQVNSLAASPDLLLKMNCMDAPRRHSVNSEYVLARLFLRSVYLSTRVSVCLFVRLTLWFVLYLYFWLW